MILHGYNGCFGIERAIGVAQAQNVGKLERRGTGKQHLASGAKFDDGALAEISRTVAGVASAANKLHRNAHRRGLGKKPRQSGDRTVLRPARRGCSFLRQNDVDLFPIRALSLRMKRGPAPPLPG